MPVVVDDDNDIKVKNSHQVIIRALDILILSLPNLKGIRSVIDVLIKNPSNPLAGQNHITTKKYFIEKQPSN